MGRQTLTVLLGVVLSFLATAAAGYVLHYLELSTGWSESQLGMAARYFINPLVAIIVGSVVAVLARRQPGVLAALSLIPWAFGFLVSRRLSVFHEIIMFFSSFLSVCLGVVAAIFIFRIRNRTRAAT